MKMNRKTWAVLVIACVFCGMAGLFLLSLKGYIPLTYTQADTLKSLEAFLDSPRDDMRGVKANGHFLEIGKRRALQVLPGYKDVFYLVRPYRQVQYRPRNMTRAEVVDLCLSISGPDLQSLRSEGLPRDPHWRGGIDGREVSILRVTRFTYLASGLSEKPLTIAQVELAKRLGMSDAEVLTQIIPIQLEWLRSLDASATRRFSELILPEVPDRIVAWLNARP